MRFSDNQARGIYGGTEEINENLLTMAFPLISVSLIGVDE